MTRSNNYIIKTEKSDINYLSMSLKEFQTSLTKKMEKISQEIIKFDDYKKFVCFIENFLLPDFYKAIQKIWLSKLTSENKINNSLSDNFFANKNLNLKITQNKEYFLETENKEYFLETQNTSEKNLVFFNENLQNRPQNIINKNMIFNEIITSKINENKIRDFKLNKSNIEIKEDTFFKNNKYCQISQDFNTQFRDSSDNHYLKSDQNKIFKKTVSELNFHNFKKNKSKFDFSIIDEELSSNKSKFDFNINNQESYSNKSKFDFNIDNEESYSNKSRVDKKNKSKFDFRVIDEELYSKVDKQNKSNFDFSVIDKELCINKSKYDFSIIEEDFLDDEAILNRKKSLIDFSKLKNKSDHKAEFYISRNTDKKKVIEKKGEKRNKNLIKNTKESNDFLIKLKIFREKEYIETRLKIKTMKSEIKKMLFKNKFEDLDYFCCKNQLNFENIFVWFLENFKINFYILSSNFFIKKDKKTKKKLYRNVFYKNEKDIISLYDRILQNFNLFRLFFHFKGNVFQIYFLLLNFIFKKKLQFSIFVQKVFSCKFTNKKIGFSKKIKKIAFLLDIYKSSTHLSNSKIFFIFAQVLRDNIFSKDIFLWQKKMNYINNEKDRNNKIDVKKFKNIKRKNCIKNDEKEEILKDELNLSKKKEIIENDNFLKFKENTNNNLKNLFAKKNKPPHQNESFLVENKNNNEKNKNSIYIENYLGNMSEIRKISCNNDLSVYYEKDGVKNNFGLSSEEKWKKFRE